MRGLLLLLWSLLGAFAVPFAAADEGVSATDPLPGSMFTRDPIDEVVPFVRDLPTLRGYRRRIAAKTLRLLMRYGRSMNAFQLALTSANGFLLSAPNVVNAPLRKQAYTVERTCITTTEHVDPLYRPLFRVEERYRHYFEPTMVTDAEGQLSPALRLDYQADGQRVAPEPAVSATAFPGRSEANVIAQGV